MRIFVPLLALMMLVTACGEAERGSVNPGESTLRVEPLEVRGGAFVEGSVSALQIEGAEGWKKPRQYREAVELKLRPGSYAVTLRNYACESACSSWQALEKLMAKQRDNNGGRPGAVERMVTKCKATVTLERGKEATMIPFINVAAKESTLLGPIGTDFCRWEGRDADLTQSAGFTASGRTN